MPHKEFDVNGIGKIEIYKRRNNRSLRLTVANDGSIRLTMPLWTPYRIGVAFLNSKIDWISKQCQKRTKTLIYNGAPIGKSHHIFFKFIDDFVPVSCSIKQNDIIVKYGLANDINDTSVQSKAEAACFKALKTQSLKLLDYRLKELAELHDFNFKQFKVKKLKSRWGSCDQQHNLVFNIFLIQLPWNLIDYVILHELTHTKVLHHGPSFWNELLKIEPKAKLLRKDLKMFHPNLLIA
jgi:predicted metal-dependent hydrolase